MLPIEFHQLELRYQALRIADPARLARMTASLAEHGQRAPVLVVGAAPPYVLIDGYCRVQALQALRRDAVAALVLAVPEPDALLLAHRLDLSRPRSALEEGWFVRELHRGHGLSLGELARRSGHSVSWLSRRLALVEQLAEPIQDLVRQGRLLPHAAMKALVPLARANPAHALRLATRAGDLPERLSARQWEALAAAYRAATPEIRERLVDHPGLFAQVHRERARPDQAEVAKAPAELFLADLGALAALARRARRRLGTLPPELFDVGWVAAVQTAWTGARADVEALARRLTETCHDRPRHPDRDHPPAPPGPRDQDHRPRPGDRQEHGQAGAH
ncbi:MAG: ParB/RepB/Spo0J family partition protein [Deferrisomatales bacterium]